jgi:hypothetical protein
MNKYGVLVVVLLPLSLLLAGCGDPPTKVGDVCQRNEHCGAEEDGFSLVCDTGIFGGSCTVQGCTSDDHTTPAVDEDEGTCPADSRCVREGEEDYYCRRTCNQQSDCGEVIVCREVCKEEEDVEVCSEECKNEMECSPFWDMDRDEVPEDAPRACIMKRALYREPTE